MKKKWLSILPSLLLTTLSGVSLTFAWFSSIYHFADGRLTPGELDADFSLAYYNHTSATWENTSSNSPVSIYLGEMRTIAFLPANSESYIKFKMNDQSEAQKHYNVILEKIEILVENTNGIFKLDGVDYYSALPSQNVFDFYMVTSSDPNLSPLSLFANYTSLPSFTVTSLDHELHASPLSMDTWTYIMLKPRLESIQNIIRKVSVLYSPYSLVFDMTFRGEVMTIDEI